MYIYTEILYNCKYMLWKYYEKANIKENLYTYICPKNKYKI